MRKRFSSFGGFHGPPYIDSEHLVIIDDEPNQQVFDDYDSLVGELERAELGVSGLQQRRPPGRNV